MNISLRKVRALLAVLVMLIGVVGPPTVATQQIVHADTSWLLDKNRQNCLTDDTTDNSKSQTSSGGDGSGISGSRADNIKAIYQYANGQYGLSGAAIAGILGNWQVESGIDPTAVEPGQSGEVVAKLQTASGTRGIGFGQWSFARRTALIDWGQAHYNGVWWTTNAELDYMFHGDTGYLPYLQQYAEQATDDVMANTVLFHNLWERSSQSPEAVKASRGGYAQDAWKYMQANGMGGSSDPTKIATITGNKQSQGNPTSTTSASGDVQDNCSSYAGSTSGTLGQSVSANGKKPSASGFWSLETLPQQYKSAITLPQFQAPDWSTSPFQGGLAGQCTEFTWAYMSQLWDGHQPTMGNGGDVWEQYKAAGAKITDNPTVGYGVSGTTGNIGAGSPAGHTGVVVAVFQDGSFLLEQFNAPPYNAPSRKPVFSLIAGTDGNSGIHFFSGVGKSKISEKK